MTDNWFKELFIDEAKAAKDYHNRGGSDNSGGGESTENRLAMYFCDTLTEIKVEDLEGVTNIPENAFSKKNSLLSVTIPEGVQTISMYGFSNSPNLKSVTFPRSITSISRYVFADCVSLDSISFPKDCQLTSLVSYTFLRCKSMKNIVLPSKIQTISDDAFYGSEKLTIVVLTSPQLVTLGGIDAFKDTPFASGGTGGTVYVPQALIESYKTATNWSALYEAGTCNFVAIEGSEYE